MAVAALTAVVVLGCSPDAAMAQARPTPPAATKPDAAFDSAKVAFEALPETERKAVQDALVWTGDFNAAVSGEFGRRTFDAINAYLARTRRPAAGTLDAPTRKALLASAQRARDAQKFTVLGDARTGVRIGVPQGILVKHDVNPNGGSRWQSADGRITLDTRAVAPAEADLAALYERSIATQIPGRQVTYKLLRPDFFVVSGETPTGKFYQRYARGPAGVRGFSIGYDKALAKDFDRAVIAIANSFAPFPEAAAVAAATPPPQPPPAAEPARPKPPLASGIVVAAGRIVTSATVAACTELRVAGARARVLKSDQAIGVALLESDAVAAKAPVAVRSARADASVLVLSHAVDAGSRPGLVVTPADIVGGRLVAPLQPGASGAPVVDRTGALVGIVGALRSTPNVVAGTVPPLAHPFIAAEPIAGLLSGSGVALANASEQPRRSAGEIAAALGAAVVPVTCGE
ncbi:MAG TPA: serine protease [Beijerinckiaceae bacterium]|nr:serine protease [Beijerinckiaceae bacterium]